MMVNEKNDKFRIIMQNLLSTKTFAMTNLSVTHWKKKRKEKAKFILNTFKYTLIKNIKQ